MPRRKKEGVDRYPNGRIRKTKQLEVVGDPRVDAVSRIIRNAIMGHSGNFDQPMAVYVMESGGAIKIGVSKNPASRVATLQTSHYGTITIYWSVTMERQDAFALERKVHTRFKKKNVHARGEWFWISPDDAVEEINRVINLFGYKSAINLNYGMDRSPYKDRGVVGDGW